MGTTTAIKNETGAKSPEDFQAIQSARCAEVTESLLSHLRDLNTALVGIRADIRTIREESLWAFAKTETGEGYKDWKSFIKSLLGDSLTEWSDRAKNSFVVMLVDEGFTAPEAAEVTDQTPAEAKKAIKKADKEADGSDVVAPTVDENGDVVTPPATPEPTAADKANKVAAQSIAQNKRVMDSAFDMSDDNLLKLFIDHRAVVVELEALLVAKGIEVPAPLEHPAAA
jgi:hypothetical protein